MLFIIASISGLFRIIITVLIVMLLIRWISSVFTNQNRNTNNDSTREYVRKNDEPNVTVTNRKSKTIQAEEGEYVDYEEVE